MRSVVAEDGPSGPERNGGCEPNCFGSAPASGSILAERGGTRALGNHDRVVSALKPEGTYVYGED